jgi:hypothetical protein
MTPRLLGLLLAGAATLSGSGSTSSSPTVGCRDTHEWVDIGQHSVSVVGGKLSVRYPAGDAHPLPEAIVIVARVEPFIQAFVGETDQEGRFAIAGVPEGQWRINVCRPGFKTLEGAIGVAPDAASERLELVTELDW